MMSLVEQLVPGTPLIFGKFFNESEGQYMIVPPDLYENEPRLYTVAKKVALDTFLENDIGGIQVGSRTADGRRSIIVIRHALAGSASTVYAGRGQDD